MNLKLTPVESMIMKEFQIDGVTITQYLLHNKPVGEVSAYTIQLRKGTPNNPENTFIGEYSKLDSAIEKIKTVVSAEDFSMKVGEFIQVTEKRVRHKIPNC